MLSAPELQRNLSLWDAMNVVLGIVIGAGIFVTPQELARLLPSSNAMFAAWIVSGLLVFCGALAFAELSAMLPATGGIYIYLREAFGPAVAFSSGWVHLFALLSGATAFIAGSFFDYLNVLVSIPDRFRTLCTLLLILLVAAIAARSSAWAVRLQNLTNLAKLAALALLIALAFFADAASAPAKSEPIGALNFAAALASCFFCYEGWSYAGFVAGELHSPQRDLPRTFALSFLAIVLLYLAVNLSYLRVLSIPDIQSSNQVGALVAGRVLGGNGAIVLAAIVLLAIVGALNGLTLAASRMYWAQSRDGVFLPGLDRLHSTWKTPAAAVAAHAAVSCLYVLFSRNLGLILTIAIFAAWTYYVIAVIGLMRLRRTRPDLPRPYRMFGYPFTPILFILGGIGFLATLSLKSAAPAITVLLIMGASFPIHAFIGRWKGERPTASLAR
jgi:basic amino acid/polyamine antiporter, APA family